MKYGQLEDGTRVSADYASKADKHFCPGCGAALILKQGEINDWHFAHECGKDCEAFTENKMTEWHIKHQNDFPEECREVRLEDPFSNEVHIADIKCGNLIIEFQHSHIDNETFENRTAFYNDYGRVVWVFDFMDKWDDGNIWWYKRRPDSSGCFAWSRPNKMLGEYHLLGCGFDVFVQLHEDLYCLVEWNPRGMKFFNGRQFSHSEFLEYLRNVYKKAYGMRKLQPREIKNPPGFLFMYNFTD